MTLVSKKANAISDSIIIIVSLFVLTLLFVFGYGAYKDSYADIQADLTDGNATALHANYYDQIPRTLDNSLAFVLVLLWVGAMVLAFFIDTHPVFFILSICLLIGVLIVGGIFSNTYQEIVTDETTYTTAFPIITYVMDNLVAFILGFAFSIIIALYAKTKLR